MLQASKILKFEFSFSSVRKLKMETQSRTTRSKARVQHSNDENGSIQLKCAPKVKTKSTVLGNLTNNSINKSSVMAPKKKSNSTTFNPKQSAQSKAGKSLKENIIPSSNSTNFSKPRRTRNSFKENVTPKDKNNVSKISELKEDSTIKSPAVVCQKELNNLAPKSINNPTKQTRTRKAAKENVTPTVQNNSSALDNLKNDSANKTTINTRKRKQNSPTMETISNSSKQTKTRKLSKENDTPGVPKNLNVLGKSTNDANSKSLTTASKQKQSVPKLNSSSTRKSKANENMSDKSSLRKLQVETNKSLIGEDVYDFVYDADKEPKPAKKKKVRKKKEVSLYKPHIKLPPAHKDSSKITSLTQLKPQQSKSREVPNTCSITAAATAVTTQLNTQNSKSQKVLNTCSAKNAGTKVSSKTAAAVQLTTQESCTNKSQELLNSCSTKNGDIDNLQLTTEIEDCSIEHQPLQSCISEIFPAEFQEYTSQTLSKYSQNQEAETGEDMSMDNCFGFNTSSQGELPIEHVASTPMKVLTSTAACRNVFISPVRKVLQLKNLPNKPARIDSEVVKNLVCIPTAPKTSMKQSLLEQFIQQVEAEPSNTEPPPSPPSVFSKVNIYICIYNVIFKQ